LTQPNVAEFARECSAGSGKLIVDVSELRFADDAGIAQLLDRIANGAQLKGASPFMELLLQAACRRPSGGNGQRAGSAVHALPRTPPHAGIAFLPRATEWP
jgi:hypothetical protein